MVACKHGMVGLASIVGTYELRIAEYVGRVVFADFIVDAHEFQVELVFLFFLAFVVGLTAAVILVIVGGDGFVVVSRCFRCRFGQYVAAAVGGDEDILTLTVVLDHCKSEVGLAVGTALAGRHLCHVDMAVLQLCQL